MGRPLACAVLCALALAGCGGDDETAVPGPGLTAPELRWVRAVSAWGDDLVQAVADVRAAHELALGGTSGLDERILRPLRECERAVARRIPTAPTPRLKGAEKLLARICADYGRFADAEAASLRGAPGEALYRAEEADARASERLLTLFQGLGSLLRDNRDLPREQGGSGSRVDPLLSAVGSNLALERIEVRCWSEDEWPDVMRERSAFSNGVLNVHETLGFAWPDDRRAHLAPEICEALDRFTLDGDGAGSEELAVAVVVLAHEIGHLRASEAAESEVECRAIQEARGLAVELGATAEQAGALVDRYWTEVYPDTDGLYHSPECHPGGYLDLDPDDPRWP